MNRTRTVLAAAGVAALTLFATAGVALAADYPDYSSGDDSHHGNDHDGNDHDGDRSDHHHHRYPIHGSGGTYFSNGPTPVCGSPIPVPLPSPCTPSN